MFYLVVGTDQDGDHFWAMFQTESTAVVHARKWGEVSFDPPELFAIDRQTLDETKVEWT